ncbi:MAG: rhodanese-like domain-containing protein [Bryobacteraceae bacterium]
MRAEEALEISTRDARERLSRNSEAVLIDVREPEELALARIAGAETIPMQSIPAEMQRLEALADEKALLFLCHHGVRSLQVAAWMREHGVDNCFSVAGGIDRWSVDVDASVPRY